MSAPSLPVWLRQVARRMITHLEDSGELVHRAAKGSARERALVREFLDKYLPRHVEALHLGDVRSAAGHVSAQQDVMIVDRNTPRLYTDEDGHQVVPIELREKQMLNRAGANAETLGYRYLGLPEKRSTWVVCSWRATDSATSATVAAPMSRPSSSLESGLGWTTT